jgi:hypothetical protein
MLMRLIIGPFWVGAGISILEYYDIVGENIRNRSPNNSNRPCLAQKPMGRIFVKKKGTRRPPNSLSVILAIKLQ